MTRKLMTILATIGLAGGCLLQTNGCSTDGAIRDLSERVGSVGTTDVLRQLAAASQQAGPLSQIEADWPSCSLEPQGPQF